MGASTNVAPVIIKRKKIIVSGGHHGGAWKVAYADFVTAMMAFFLLMWLLNATTEKQRKGLSDYFSPSIPITRMSGGGDGAFGGASMYTEDTLKDEGSGATNQNPTKARQSRGTTGVDQQNQRDRANRDFTSLEAKLMGRGGESLVTDEALKHIVTRVTDEGLIIELFATPGVPLFDKDSAKPTPMLRDLTRMIARVIGKVTNNVALGGYIRARPVVLANNPVWELSTARASRMRSLLEGSGLDAERVRRVTGHADRKPVAKNPMDVRNNRVEVILLRN
ncbi:MAG: chemotaxis protein MotB [Rhodobacteraceae bacterium]|nr:MAG: chemotaxis protein MotB [Paracoccaceae bacterium]